MKTKLTIIAATILLSACAPKELSPGGEKVRILDPDEVQSCREIGKVNNSTTAKFIVERGEDAVAKELRIMGRNSAANMGGDTIVPLTVIEAGQQTFVVYKCVNPDG